MITLEQNAQQGTGSSVMGENIRLKRWEDAFTGTDYGYPMVIIDSGHQVLQGSKGDYYETYYDWTAKETPRKPQATVSATFRQVSTHMEFQVDVTNLSTITLSPDYDANVFVIVWEDMVSPLTKSVTHRLERAVAYKPITSLAPNESDTYNFNSYNIYSVDWTKLHAVAFVEYRPGKTTGAYDMLQAAFATGPSIYTNPSSLTFSLNPASPGNPQSTVFVGGSPAGMSWTLTSKPSWVTMPSSGTVGSSITASVNVSGLIPCKNSGEIVLSTTQAPAKSAHIPITVDFSPVASLTASPGSLNLVINPNNPQDLQSSVQLTGAPPAIAWSVTSKPTWASVSPSTGTTTSSPVVRAFVSAMQPGITYQGKVTFTSPSCPAVTRDVPVNVVYPTFSLSDDSLSYLVDPYNPSDPKTTIQTSGYPVTDTWTATSNANWVTASPGNGTVGSTFTVKIDHTALQPDENVGQITVVSVYSGITMTQTISIRVVYKPPHPVYLAVTGKAK